MLLSVNQLLGRTLAGSDGEFGAIEDLYFGDEDWVLRYLAVHAGNWLSGRSVLVSPFAFRPDALGATHDAPVRVELTREQLADSPELDVRQGITRGYEQSYLSYFGYPTYWGGPGLWGLSGVPSVANAAPDGEYVPVSEEDRELHELLDEEDTSHLRSIKEVTGYHVEARDGRIGQIDDFIYDDADWAIRYLVLDTREWWPGGRKVLIGSDWVEDIDWSRRSLSVGIARGRVRESPEFTPRAPLSRDYEQRLHDYYQRGPYWG
ncbi:MAG TPA: hypothetical protein VFG73_05755 [Rhodanobacteraceae bacterium]|nr:hypothetical protein [Rhodanobacteraceae bacterium]